jgi:predicted SprT family Zn-dependent metalloprotease
MDEHGLRDWTLVLDRSTRRFGACKPSMRTISLSWRLTLLNNPDEVRETLLHEIAHALTPGDGHGEKWKAMCRKLGIRAKRCFTADEVKLPARRASRMEIGCVTCAWWADRTRFGSPGLVCKRCRAPVTYRERATGRLFRVERAPTGRATLRQVV